MPAMVETMNQSSLASVSYTAISGMVESSISPER